MKSKSIMKRELVQKGGMVYDPRIKKRINIDFSSNPALVFAFMQEGLGEKVDWGFIKRYAEYCEEEIK